MRRLRGDLADLVIIHIVDDLAGKDALQRAQETILDPMVAILSMKVVIAIWMRNNQDEAFLATGNVRLTS